MSEELLRVSNLTTCFTNKRRGNYAVLHEVSLTLNRGEVVGFVGESGSGKSMTMLSMLQLLPGNAYVEGGEVFLDGEGDNLLKNKPNSNAMRKVRGGRIGMIFQEPMTSLNPLMTVGDQIAETIIEHLHLDKAAAKQKAIEMMKLVKIPDAEQRYKDLPLQFSGGMRQRVMIAMVLAAEPDVLIADEATTALDVTTQAVLLDMMKNLSQEKGIALIIVTHNLGIVARYADRIYVMYSGKVVEYGSAMDIFYRPLHPYTICLLRAIPRLDDPKDRKLIPIEGLPPRSARQSTTCPFFSRCKYRGPACRQPAPEFIDYGDGHFAACHRTEQELLMVNRRVEAMNNVRRTAKTMSDEVVFEVKDVAKSFNIYRGLMKRKVAEFNAIEDISFQLHRGETLGIVGESGCGKTTLARTLLRMYEPSAGEIRMFGEDITKLSAKQLVPHRKRMAMVFQDPSSSLDMRFTAGQSVAEPMVIHKIYSKKEDMEKRVDELFTLVGLDPEMKERYPHEFSGGQRQRIGVARALASNPDILLLDEPISALDVSIQAQIINLLEDLQAQLGLSYMFIAHDLSVVKHISDRILVMYLGRIMEIADSYDLYENPMHPYTQALLSAVPIADPAVEKERSFEAILGEVPSVINRPKGCPFSNRCPKATEQCLSEVPKATMRSNGHIVACFNY